MKKIVNLLIILALLPAMSLLFIAGCGGDSDVLPPPPAQLKPVSPSNLTATALTSDSIRLEWTDRSQNEEGFEIYESVGDNSSYAMLLTVNENITSKTISGKAPATKYYYKLAAYNQGTKSDYSNEVSVTTKDIPPRSPVNLVGQLKTAPLRVDLAWADSSHNEQGFRIQRKTGDGGVWSGVADLPPNSEMHTDNSGLDMDNTYIYRVIAYNTAGNSAPSNELRIVTSATTAPTPPTIQSVTAISTTSLSIKWTANSTNHTGFTIERKMTVGGTFSEVKTVGAGDTEWIDAGLAVNTSYTYRMRSFNNIGPSGYSNEVAGNTLEEGAIEVPTSVTAVATSENEIKVTWSYPDGRALDQFLIERKSTDGVWRPHAELPQTAGMEDRLYLDITVVQDTEYYYRMQAVKDGKKSGYSNEAYVRTPGTSSTIPNAPTDLEVVLTATASEMLIKWRDNSNNEAGFKLELAVDDQPWADLGQAGMDETQYLHTGLAGSWHKYRVYAFNVKGNSNYSNEDSVYVPPAEQINDPSNLRLSYNRVSSRIIIEWDDNSENEDGFKLEAKTATNPNWWQYATPPRNATVTSLDNPTPGETYWFRIRAYNGTSHSAYSNVDSIVVPLEFVAPFGIKAINWDENTIKVTWNDRNQNPEQFHLEQKIDPAGDWNHLVDTDVATREHMIPDVQRGVIYYFRVRASRMAMTEYSPWSEICSVKTAERVLLAPGNFVGGFNKTREVWLSWEYDIAHPELKFQIQRKLGRGGIYPDKEWILNGDSREYTDMDIALGQDYLYRIRALLGRDSSLWARQEPYLGPPTPPEFLREVIGTLTSYSVSIEWADKSENESWFEIEINHEPRPEWVICGTSASDAPSFEVTGLAPRTTYNLRVLAVMDVGDGQLRSPRSNTIQIITPERQPGEEVVHWVGDIPFTMVWIKKGQFIMGGDSLEDPQSGAMERPRHNVAIDTAFWMCKTEITQTQYEELMGDNPSANKDPNLPVENVSLQNVRDFINRFAQHNSFGWRLPYECEWEYACRAGTRERYYWGHDTTGDEARDNAWFNWNSGTTRPVGQLGANMWGLCDMSGNVNELCFDYWHPNYIGAPNKQVPWMEPADQYYVMRGGCYEDQPHKLRSTARDYFRGPAGSIGFRLVKVRDDF